MDASKVARHQRMFIHMGTVVWVRTVHCWAFYLIHHIHCVMVTVHYSVGVKGWCMV